MSIKVSKTFSYKIIKKQPECLARSGVISTPHGKIKTPAFIAVGTKATVKALTPEQIKSTGVQAVLSNAYHLYLQPGVERIEKAGGLAKFKNWDGPTYTDSGGFQVLSLGVGYKKIITMDAHASMHNSTTKKGERLAKVDDEGVTFKSHIDGSKHLFTPKQSMQIQYKIGADIIFAFDECTSIAQPYDYQIEALNRTEKWAKICLKEHNKLIKNNPTKPYQALFGVVQGANYEDLRKSAAEFMSKQGFDGYGIGGAFEKQKLGEIVGWVNSILPENKPRHLLGLSEPDDIFTGIENGIDTFDCVSPARIGRNGTLYSLDGKINITNAKFADDHSRVLVDCDCYTCQNYTKAYMHHLFKAGERLSATLATIHNISFISKLVDDIRLSIEDSSFFELKENWLSRFYKK